MSTPLPAGERAAETHLYKYGSNVTWLEDLILRHRLYIPTVSELNDPNDSRPRMKKLSGRELARFLAMHQVKQNPALAQARPELNARIQELLHGMNIEELFQWTVLRMDEDLASRRVYSMTIRWNNLKMWAQYGNGHKGYCLEFANDANHRLFGMARRCIYDDSFEMDLTYEGHITPVWYLLKNSDWRCEEEVRILLPRAFGGPSFDIGSDVLTRVILGRQMLPEDAEKIRGWASRRTPPLAVAETTYDQFTRSFSLR